MFLSPHCSIPPNFCVNLGTGSLDEARNWVEYCKVEKGTYYSDLRRKNGFEKPHKVTYWGLGLSLIHIFTKPFLEKEKYITRIITIT